MPLSSGTVLNNRYRIVRLLGQGGMGAVYRAWDTSLNKPCALKENLATSPDASRQFLREAQILSGINQLNLPRVTDHFSLPGQGQYLVMDFVEGEDLDTIYQRQGVLPELQVMPWITQVCDALTYLHTHVPPIIHRDIKPANIRITPQGQAMLVDFGIAKTYDPKMATTTGARAITPGFSPPEQYTHSGTTPQSDIYSLGATLYTLLTGVQLPESINLLLAERQGITPATVQPPHLIRPEISIKTSLAIMKAIKLEPGQRFATVEDFKQALLGTQPPAAIYPAVGMTAVASTGSAYDETLVALPIQHPSGKKWGRVAIGLAAILILLIFAAVWFLNREQDTAAINNNGITTQEKANILPTSTINTDLPPTTAIPEYSSTPAPTLEPSFTPVPATDIIPTITFTAPPLALLTASPQPTDTPIPSPTRRTSARVLWDTSHGPRLSSTGQYYDPDGIYNSLKNLLAGQDITLISGSLSNLSGYEAVVIASVSSVDQAYSSQEANELLRYVTSGGGLLIMGEQPGFSNHVQAVGDVFGVQFAQQPTLDGGCNQFATHSIFSGISQIHFYQGGSLGIGGSAQGIAWMGGSISIVQALTGTGRMIATGDGALFDERILPEDDNMAFAINLFRWLTFMID
jgi:serine/threonine protein kinase